MKATWSNLLVRSYCAQGTGSEIGIASGPSAHFCVSAISIGSSRSQNTHFNSVRPVVAGTGTIRFPHCKHRVTRSTAVLPFDGSTFWNGTFVPELSSLLREGIAMQEAMNRIMQAYTMIANLTPEQAQATRERLAAHLAGVDADERALAVEGLRYLRGLDRVSRRRVTREAT